MKNAKCKKENAKCQEREEFGNPFAFFGFAFAVTIDLPMILPSCSTSSSSSPRRSLQLSTP